jgi:hypothetical protein
VDDDFAVYPFRRQLVEDTILIEALPETRPARPQPQAQPPIARSAPRRRPPSPLRWAVPAAFAAFLVALAGTATISHPQEVQHAIQDQIVPPAEAAAKPKRRTLAPRRQQFVPDVTGLQATRAAKLLQQSRFRVRVKRIVGKPGLVLEQRPKAATEVRKPGVVLLVVGNAKPKPEPVAPVVTPTVIVTSVVGLPREAAVQALVNEGLGVRIYGVRSSRPAGTVVAQSPTSGSRAEVGSYARINVAVN